MEIKDEVQVFNLENACPLLKTLTLHSGNTEVEKTFHNLEIRIVSRKKNVSL